jgi:hypothetical protein
MECSSLNLDESNIHSISVHIYENKYNNYKHCTWFPQLLRHQNGPVGSKRFFLVWPKSSLLVCRQQDIYSWFAKWYKL